MNIQVGDIIKLENNQPVTVSTSLGSGSGFFFFGWSEYGVALLALPTTAFGDFHLPHFASRDQQCL